MQRVVFGLVAIGLSGAAAFAGCSASNGGDPFGNDGSGGSAAAASGGNGVGGENILVGGGGGGGNEYGCSPDLQKIIDGNGNVIQECPPDQGCSGGVCVPACQAAADSQGNVGCDFVVANPHFYVGIAPPCFSVFVANNWPKAAQLSVTRGGVSYDVTTFGRIAQNNPNTATWPAVPAEGVPPGEVAVLFLGHDPSSVNGGTPLTCPVPPAVAQGGGSAVAGTARGQAWHITSDVPISSYDILPYGGAQSFLPSAELLLPTTAWGTNYIAVLPRISSGPPWGQIVASENATTVEILPTIGLPGGAGVNAAAPNALATFTLDAGEYIQWQLPNGQDMTGTVIQSDKPVAFTGGEAYICYTSATSGGGGCDSAHQQIPPVAALASEYVAPPYTTRGSGPESIPYRFVGAVDGTTLSFDPPIAGAPASLGQGQVADFEASVPFIVRSQDANHPFYVGQLMTGCFVTGGNSQLGDEEFVNILPPAQYLSKYVFFSDPTYPTTNLVFVRKATPSGFLEVDVECHGTVTGWTDIGSSGEYQLANLDLIRLGVPNGACSNGPQVASSDGPFGLMVWGLDTYSSYAYPAGGSVAPINTVIVPPTPK